MDTRLESESCPSQSRSAVQESSSDLSDASTSFEEIFEEIPGHRNKRRRLSEEPEESDVPDVQVSSRSSAIASRVKSRSNGNIKSAGEIERPVISNGKVVDSQASFASLDVAPWLIASLGAMEIKRPTGIQKGCIPKILEGRDVIGGSRTGSGKTVTFTVPILQKLAEDAVGIYALILTPTR